MNQQLPACPEGIKPILSMTFNDRGQMDLIDMQFIICRVIYMDPSLLPGPSNKVLLPPCIKEQTGK